MSVNLRIFLTVYNARENSLTSARETFVDTQIAYAHVTYALWGTKKIHTCGSYKWAIVGKCVRISWGGRHLSPTCGDPHKEYH